MLQHDPDLEAERGPGGTLIFLDGQHYCVVGSEFVSVAESDCYAFGETRDQAIANYAMKRKGRLPFKLNSFMCEPTGNRSQGYAGNAKGVHLMKLTALQSPHFAPP
ncbi:MAG: hypothetical protein ACR2IH_07805 [Pyrinomonadaceae bacterium]